MAQVMYWYIFGVINRGTGAECISKRYNWADGYIYDCIINKCLRNNPEDRFQSIDEIEEFYEQEKLDTKELDPFEDMYKFHSAVLSIVPEFYGQAFSITDKNIMNKLFEKIFEEKYNRPIEFNTGIGNNSISSIKRLENDDFLMGARQLNIQRVWGLLTNCIYDEFLKGSINFKADVMKDYGQLRQQTMAYVRKEEDTLPFRVGTFYYAQGCGLYLIVAYASEEELSLAEELLESLSYTGIGGKKSSGMGKFEFRRGKPSEELEKRLQKKSSKNILISTALPMEQELEQALEGAAYLLEKRSGFVASSSYAPEWR